MPRSSSTSTRCRRPTGSPSACPVAARPSPSPSGSGCRQSIVADARSRLTEAQRSFEATLASIKATEGETSEALERARAAEVRAAEALRDGRGGATPGAPRARRRRPRGTGRGRPRRGGPARRAGRDPPGARAGDGHGRRAGCGRRPRGVDRRAACRPWSPIAVSQPLEPQRWQLGDRARSRSGGWEGRIAALDRDGRRATLEAGGLRIAVELDDLVPALGPAAGRDGWDRGHLECRGGTADPVALGGVVARPAGSPGGGGVGDADALPRRRLAGGPDRRSRSSTASAPARCATPSGPRPRPARWSSRSGRASGGEGGDGATIVAF